MRNPTCATVLPVAALLLTTSMVVQASLLRAGSKPENGLVNPNSTDVCWKGAYGRGVGTPIDTCKCVFIALRRARSAVQHTEPSRFTLSLTQASASTQRRVMLPSLPNKLHRA